MIEILVSNEVDQFTFELLWLIARKNNICLIRGHQTRELFEPKIYDTAALTVADLFLTCYKAIQRIKQAAQTA